MDSIKVLEDFIKMTNDLSKLNVVQQMFEYPKQMTEFFENIYNDGYKKGFSDGTIFRENKQIQQN